MPVAPATEKQCVLPALPFQAGIVLMVQAWEGRWVTSPLSHL